MNTSRDGCFKSIYLYVELNLQYLYLVSIYLLENICLYCLQFILACNMVCPIMPSWFGNKWGQGGLSIDVNIDCAMSI